MVCLWQVPEDSDDRGGSLPCTVAMAERSTMKQEWKKREWSEERKKEMKQEWNCPGPEWRIKWKGWRWCGRNPTPRLCGMCLGWGLGDRGVPSRLLLWPLWGDSYLVRGRDSGRLHVCRLVCGGCMLGRCMCWGLVSARGCVFLSRVTVVSVLCWLLFSLLSCRMPASVAMPVSDCICSRWPWSPASLSAILLPVTPMCALTHVMPMSIWYCPRLHRADLMSLSILRVSQLSGCTWWWCWLDSLIVGAPGPCHWFGGELAGALAVLYLLQLRAHRGMYL